MWEKKPKTVIRNGIHIGATKEAIDSVSKGVLEIIKHPGDPNVLIKALDVLGNSVGVNNSNISNCHFEVKG